VIAAEQSPGHARALLGWTQETLADKAQISSDGAETPRNPKAGWMCIETTRDQVRRAFWRA
jgi:hypothetical protein